MNDRNDRVRLSTTARVAAALSALAALAAFAPADAGITPVDSVITYQGQLRNVGGPIDGTASARFRLFNQEFGGGQVGATLTACGLTLVDGLFTVELDFGATAFDGSARWLEIAVQSPAGDCATFTPLAPRQPISAAPYALRSLAPWETNGNFIFYNTGNVGIGTTTPDTDLEVSQANATVRLTSTATDGTSTLDLKGDAPGGFSVNTLGTIRFLDELNNVNAQISSNKGFLGQPLVFTVDGVAQMALSSNGDLGVGTTLPIAKLQLVGGTDSEPSTGGFLVIGGINEGNISMDNNEIMARTDGAVSTLFLNNDGGDVSICAGGSGQVGIGTSPTTQTLTVFNSLFVTGGAQPRIDVAPNGFILMDTGADIIITEGGLEVNTTSGGQTFFNRVNPDGTLVNFLNDGTTAGGISVIGSTVIYGTFTGAHNGWVESPIEPGSLVTLAGQIRRAHAGPNCEPTYGIAKTTVANDPRCAGSYVSAPDPADPTSQHLFAAVGNGEMWVVDSGTGDIDPGDALISSDVAGSAMKDDPTRFAVGHVVARAAEPVKWSAVAKDRNGVKRVLLSVFYDRFDRQGDAVALAATVESLRTENDTLRARLDAIEQKMATLAQGAGATKGVR